MILGINDIKRLSTVETIDSDTEMDFTVISRLTVAAGCNLDFRESTDRAHEENSERIHKELYGDLKAELEAIHYIIQNDPSLHCTNSISKRISELIKKLEG